MCGSLPLIDGGFFINLTYGAQLSYSSQGAFSRKNGGSVK
jgi:hypothetical protein